MIHFLERFKIPTFLGLGIVLAAVVGGVYLIIQQQTSLSSSASNFTPKNITVSNINDSQATISWETPDKTHSIVSYGLSSFQEKTAIDERDTDTPLTYYTHIVRLENLLPSTTYSFRVISEKIKSDTLTFKTAAPLDSQNGFRPIFGTVKNGEEFLEDGIVYLTMPGAITQVAAIKNLGNFLIPLSSIYKADLSDIYPLSEETVAKLTVVSKDQQTQASIKLSEDGLILPPLILGQIVDLTDYVFESTPEAQATSSAKITPTNEELSIFDLNDDGSINAADNAIVLKNYGKNPQNKRADLNKDGIVNEEDLKLMSEKINHG